MTIMVFDLTDEEVAILTYAIEGYQLEDLEQNVNMKSAHRQLISRLDAEYKKRGLDYNQFEKAQPTCEKCGQNLPEVEDDR
jgi:uncharacterized protein (UPF0212 family)